MTHKCKLCLPPDLYSVTSNHPTQQNTEAYCCSYCYGGRNFTFMGHIHFLS